MVVCVYALRRGSARLQLAFAWMINKMVFHANQASRCHHRQKPTFTFKRTVYDA